MKEIQVARQAAEHLKQIHVRDRIRRLSLLKKIILNKRENIIDRIQADTGKSRSDALISEIYYLSF